MIICSTNAYYHKGQQPGEHNLGAIQVHSRAASVQLANRRLGASGKQKPLPQGGGFCLPFGTRALLALQTFIIG